MYKIVESCFIYEICKDSENILSSTAALGSKFVSPNGVTCSARLALCSVFSHTTLNVVVFQ